MYLTRCSTVFLFGVLGSSQKRAHWWVVYLISSLLQIHQQAWREFCSATTRTNSTNKIASPQKNSLVSSRNVLQTIWYSQKAPEKMVRKTNYFLRLLDSRRTTVLATYCQTDTYQKKIESPSKLQELKKYTILAVKNKHSESTHILHKILLVRSLQNYKNTPITRFFPSPAASTAQQNLIPSCKSTTKYNFQNSSNDSLGTLSTLTPSDEQLDSLSLFHKNSQIHTFRMYDIPAIISSPHQILFRPYLPPSTNICRSFSNDVLLPLAPKKNLV